MVPLHQVSLDVLQGGLSSLVESLLAAERRDEVGFLALPVSNLDRLDVVTPGDTPQRFTLRSARFGVRNDCEFLAVGAMNSSRHAADCRVGADDRTNCERRRRRQNKM